MTTSAETRLAPERYFELLDADAERLLEMGERGLKEPVPSCPGWDVAEVVWHVATVFEHKIRVMSDNAWPDPWPPAAWPFADDEELEFLRSATANLFEEFSRHQLDEPTKTFGDDSTIGFWARRMACEVVVHRIDAELAHDAVTAVPGDLAIDGVDEMLRVFLSGPWWTERVATAHPVDTGVAVETEGRRWICDVRRAEARVVDEPTVPVAATISGAAPDVFLWLWGRRGTESIEVSGDQSVVHEFRARLVECSA